MPQREPTLDDLLDDPIVRKVMARDGFSPDDFRNLFQKAQARKACSDLRRP